jgi:hypothetical protein
MQDSMNYPATTLGNNAPWISPTSLIVVTNTSLSYSNLADFSPPAQCAEVLPGTTAVSYRSLDTTANNGVVYFSFVMNFLSKPGNYYIAGLLQSTNAPPGGSSADPLDLIDNSSGTGFKLGVRAKAGTTTYIANTLPTNVPCFVVMKYNFANGLASLYINPSPGGTEPASPDASSTTTTIVPDLSYAYLRSGSSTAGTFLVSRLRVATTWSEATPANAINNVLFFSVQPTNGTAGNSLANVTVQLQDGFGSNLPSNNVPISVSLNGGTFASGTTTVNTGASGAAVFNNLVINNSGNYSLTASAGGYNSATSSNFNIVPAATDHYVLTAPALAYAGQPFAVLGYAVDVFGNVVTTDSSTVLNLTSSTGNVRFDSDANGFFDNTNLTLSAGAFNYSALDSSLESALLICTDTRGKIGLSGTVNIVSNGISANGAALTAFLDSLQVTNYWIGGSSVNWLTGAPGGSGANKTIGTATHCSAFAAAAAEMLGIYLLRPPDASDVDLANHQADWFVTNTASWFPITGMTNAQHQANAGVLVMASYKSSSGSGHIAILRASNRTDADVNGTGPEECQSGEYNFGDTNVSTGFNQHAGAFPNGIKYYGHSVSYPVGMTWPVFSATAVVGQNFSAGMTTIVGRRYQLQWSSNLLNWNPLTTFTNSNSPLTFYYTNSPFTDSAGSTRKFYRLQSL